MRGLGMVLMFAAHLAMAWFSSLPIWEAISFLLE